MKQRRFNTHPLIQKIFAQHLDGLNLSLREEIQISATRSSNTKTRLNSSLLTMKLLHYFHEHIFQEHVVFVFFMITFFISLYSILLVFEFCVQPFASHFKASQLTPQPNLANASPIGYNPMNTTVKVKLIS